MVQWHKCALSGSEDVSTEKEKLEVRQRHDALMVVWFAMPLLEVSLKTDGVRNIQRYLENPLPSHTSETLTVSTSKPVR